MGFAKKLAGQMPISIDLKGRSIGPGSEDSMADGWSPSEYQLWNASNAGGSEASGVLAVLQRLHSMPNLFEGLY